MVPSDDSRLLAAAVAGDRPAMDELVRRHAPLVLVACRRQLPAAEADDAAQAVFLVLWRRAGAAAAAPGLPGWLVVTARQVCANARRALTRRRAAERAAPVPAGEAPPNEARALLDQALADLPATEREAVVRRHLLGEDPAAVAAALGCAEGTVHSRTSRGLERLRAWFARRGIACSAAALAGLCADECAAAEAIPASMAMACASPSSTACSLAVSTTAFPYLLVGALIMLCAALLLIPILTMAVAVAPAGEMPELRIYSIPDLYQTEVRLYEPEPGQLKPLDPDPEPLLASDPLTVAALDSCHNLRDLCDRLQARAGERSVVRLIDPCMTDEDLMQDCPRWTTVTGLRRTLSTFSEPLLPDLDINRTVLVVANRTGHRRIDADLRAVRELRHQRVLAQPSVMETITALRRVCAEHQLFRDLSTEPFKGDWSTAPALPHQALPIVVPATGNRRFVVIWLPENRDVFRPVAVASDGRECLIVASGFISWRPDLRPALIALDLRQRLDQGEIRAPLLSDHWREAAMSAMIGRGYTSDGGSPDFDRLRADLTAFVQQVAKPVHTGF